MYNTRPSPNFDTFGIHRHFQELITCKTKQNKGKFLWDRGTLEETSHFAALGFHERTEVSFRDYKG